MYNTIIIVYATVVNFVSNEQLQYYDLWLRATRDFSANHACSCCSFGLTHAAEIDLVDNGASFFIHRQPYNSAVVYKLR